jgi:hypothetical protein
MCIEWVSGSPITAPKWKHNVRAEEERVPTENMPANERTDLLIMGMIRDEKEKQFHKAHQVNYSIISSFCPFLFNY